MNAFPFKYILLSTLHEAFSEMSESFHISFLHNPILSDESRCDVSNEEGETFREMHSLMLPPPRRIINHVNDKCLSIQDHGSLHPGEEIGCFQRLPL